MRNVRRKRLHHPRVVRDTGGEDGSRVREVVFGFCEGCRVLIGEVHFGSSFPTSGRERSVTNLWLERDQGLNAHQRWAALRSRPEVGNEANYFFVSSVTVASLVPPS